MCQWILRISKRKKISDLRYIGKMLSIKSMTKNDKTRIDRSNFGQRAPEHCFDKTETGRFKTALTEADRAESREIEARKEQNLSPGANRNSGRYKRDKT